MCICTRTFVPYTHLLPWDCSFNCSGRIHAHTKRGHNLAVFMLSLGDTEVTNTHMNTFSKGMIEQETDILAQF